MHQFIALLFRLYNCMNITKMLCSEKPHHRYIIYHETFHADHIYCLDILCPVGTLQPKYFYYEEPSR